MQKQHNSLPTQGMKLSIIALSNTPARAGINSLQDEIQDFACRESGTFMVRFWYVFVFAEFIMS
jgi:hypothetical protein